MYSGRQRAEAAKAVPDAGRGYLRVTTSASMNRIVPMKLASSMGPVMAPPSSSVPSSPAELLRAATAHSRQPADCKRSLFRYFMYASSYTQRLTTQSARIVKIPARALYLLFCPFVSPRGRLARTIGTQISLQPRCSSGQSSGTAAPWSDSCTGRASCPAEIRNC